MNKFVKIIMGALFGALLVLQFFRGSYPEISGDNPGDIFQQYAIDQEISATIRSACYDCHSMETSYPWYTQIAPISWLIIQDINKGREELNFSTWSELTKRKKIRKLNDISEEVEEHKMPLPIYVKLHGHANLSDEQRELIIAWADDLAKQVLRE